MIGLVVGSDLVIASFVAAIFSAVAGVSGDTVLFGIIVLAVDFALVLSVFGAIQLSSGFSRGWFFRKYVDWSMF